MSSRRFEKEFPCIWEEIYARKDSEFFREPVNWKALNLFDYPKIITCPMDLTTLKSNFENGLYHTSADLALDMRLIFFNAMTYNPTGSKVYGYARSLSDFWESQWMHIVPAEDDIGRPPTADQLKELIETCHRVSSDDLGKGLQLLDGYCPNCLIKKPNSGEIEVNTDLITGEGYRELSKYFNAIITTPLASQPTASSRRTSTRRGAT